MSKIQVIVLNDDNHSKSYVTRGSYYNDAAKFMKECLLKPHTCEYEIREVYICNPQGALAQLEEEEFYELFDLLDWTNNPGELAQTDFVKWQRREAAFDLFWENGEEWLYA